MKHNNLTLFYCLKTTSRVAHFSVTDREQPGCCSAEAELRQQETLTWSEFRVAMASPLSVSTKVIVIYVAESKICLYFCGVFEY